ncbi:MAG: N-acyl-D-aspartate deacylase [Acidobacteria bacterium]|nr:N-acyl-D-aspartate deacylase [Acidobacteriota bacterium]
MLRSLLRPMAVVLVLAATAAAPRAQGPVIAIKGATVLTVTKGAIPNGTVIVRDGKIAAVGAAIPIPPGAEVVDASGRFLSPGIIDEHSHIAADSTNEGGTTVSSMTSVMDVLDPEDVDIYRDLAGGLTVASVFHGSANPIGGTNTVIKLRWGKARAEDLAFDAALPGLKFALGENPKDMRQFGQTGPRRYPTSRPGVEFVIREAFTRAKAYRQAWQDYERRRKAGERVAPPRRDLQLDPLVEVLEGRRLAHVHAYRADEMLMMLRLAEELGFKVATFEHGLEGYKLSRELAAHGAGVGTFADWWGYKIEAIDAIPYNAALMMRAGVVVSINSDSAEHARRLNTEAAKMMKWGGLTEDEALALVTINPARQLRVDKRVGSIEAGKDADLVLWSHHPLSSYAVVERTYVDGRLCYDRQADLARVARVAEEKAALVAAEKASTAADTEKEKKRGPDAGAAGRAAEAGRGPDRGARPRPPAAAPDEADLARLAPKMTAGHLAKGLLAITNAKIVPVSRPAIDRGTVVIRDGRIEALGASVAVPAKATVIDAAGAEVYPGWINARTTLGLAEPGARGYEDTAEMLDFNPQLRTVVAYHNDSEAIPVARANGVTTVAVFPSGGLLGGQVPVMNLDGDTWEESTLRPIAGVSFQFPGIGGRRRAFGGGAPLGPERTYDELRKERDKRLDGLSRLLDQARAYAAAGAGRDRDWVLEALVPVVQRRLPLFTSAATEADIRDAVAFADRAGIRIVIASGPEAALAAPLLKEKNVPVILGPVLTLPSREDQFHAASYQAAGELARAGVRFAFATSDTANVRQLPYHAAMSVAWGLPREQALRALTIDAAEILGVSGEVGSLEPGKVANLLIAKGDPLEARTEVTHVIVNGREVDLGNKQLSLYERYLKRQ